MTKFLNLLLGFLILGIIVYLVYISGQVLLNAFSGLASSLQTAIASAFALIIVAGIGFFANKTIEQRKSIELAIRPRKVELYENFVRFFLKVLGNGKVYPKPSEKEIMKFYADSTPLLMSFASNKVIEKWGRLRLKMADDEGVENMFQLEQLLIEIRRDLGHSSRGLKKGDVLRLMINDIDDYLDSQ